MMAANYESVDEGQSSDLMRLNKSSSSASVASRLYTNGTRGSRRGSFDSEADMMNFSDSETPMHELNEICSQMTTLTRKVDELEEERMSSSREFARLKTDNVVLIERVHFLEEQLQTNELRWCERLAEERARNKEIISRMEREKSLEIESCTLKYQVLEKDCSALQKENEKQHEEVLNLQMALESSRDELNEANALCESLEDERIKLMREYKRFREEAQQDIDSSSELVEELSRQTDELRRQKYASAPRKSSLENAAFEIEIDRLRSANKSLKEQNEELQAQMLHSSVERGQSLLSDRLPSLAEELNGKDTTELIKALKEQEICNQKLRLYINGILMRVIELHPEILEIKEAGSSSAKEDS